MDARGKPIQDHVAGEVARTMVGALLGAALVWALARYTPLKPQWWVGVAVGAAVGAAGEWDEANK